MQSDQIVSTDDQTTFNVGGEQNGDSYGPALKGQVAHGRSHVLHAGSAGVGNVDLFPIYFTSIFMFFPLEGNFFPPGSPSLRPLIILR